LTVFAEPVAKTNLKILPFMEMLVTPEPKGTGIELPMCVVKVRVLLARETLLSHWVLLKALRTAGARSTDLTGPSDSVALRVLLPGTERADRVDGKGRVTLELAELDLFKIRVLPERLTSVTATGIALSTYGERSTVCVEPSAKTRFKILPNINAFATAGPKGTGIELPICVVKVRVLFARATLLSHWVSLRALCIAGFKSTDWLEVFESMAFNVEVETVRSERNGVLGGRGSGIVSMLLFVRVMTLLDKFASITEGVTPSCTAAMAAFT
jgi:hypothetical protein